MYNTLAQVRINVGFDIHTILDIQIDCSFNNYTKELVKGILIPEEMNEIAYLSPRICDSSF